MKLADRATYPFCGAEAGEGAEELAAGLVVITLSNKQPNHSQQQRETEKGNEDMHTK